MEVDYDIAEKAWETLLTMYDSDGNRIDSSKNTKSIATDIEVLEFFTTIMRNDEADVMKRLKAAELMAKHYGMFKTENKSRMSDFAQDWINGIISLSDDNIDKNYL